MAEDCCVCVCAGRGGEGAGNRDNKGCVCVCVREVGGGPYFVGLHSLFSCLPSSCTVLVRSSGWVAILVGVSLLVFPRPAPITPSSSSSSPHIAPTNTASFVCALTLSLSLSLCRPCLPLPSRLACTQSRRQRFYPTRAHKTRNAKDLDLVYI